MTTSTAALQTTTTVAAVDPVAAVETFAGITTDHVITLAQAADRGRGGAVFVNGTAANVDVATTATSTTLTYENASLIVECFDSGNSPISLDDQSRFQLHRGDSVRVSITGFSPGTDVHFALFSTPTALGSITTDDFGTGHQQWVIPDGVTAGIHTLIASGDLPASANTVFGLRIVVPQDSLFTKLSNSTAVRIMLVLAVIAGLLIPATRRRRAA